MPVQKKSTKKEEVRHKAHGQGRIKAQGTRHKEG
jgi:hypothetical protein